MAPQVVYSNEQAVYELPYRAEPYRVWDGDRYTRWERHREFERARWEHARQEHEERHGDRGEHRRDHDDSHRWGHD